MNSGYPYEDNFLPDVKSNHISFTTVRLLHLVQPGMKDQTVSIHVQSQAEKRVKN